MEEINTDYKRRIWKIEAELFNMRNPWLSSFNLWNRLNTYPFHDDIPPESYLRKQKSKPY